MMGVADGEDEGCACRGGTNGNSSTNNNTSSGNLKIVLNGKPLTRGSGGGGGSGAEATTAGASSRVGAATLAAAAAASSPPPRRPTSPAAALTEWLASLSLSSYESRLVSQGFDTLEAMSTVTEADLEAMGFLKGHLRLLLARASSAAALSTSGDMPREASSGGGGGGGGRGSAWEVAPATPPSAATDPSADTANSVSISYPGVLKPNGIEDRNRVAPSAGAVASPGTTFRNMAAANGETNGVRRKRYGTEEQDNEAYEDDGGDKEEDDEEDMYCDAQALQPMRGLDNGNNNSKYVGANGTGNGGRGEEFKELKPEEIEVDEVIGEGSFGVVRRARWRGMDVAVKELKVSIAYAAAAVSSNGSADLSSGAGTATATMMVDDGSRQRISSMDGEEEMRHEARMLAKVCNHVW